MTEPEPSSGTSTLSHEALIRCRRVSRADTIRARSLLELGPLQLLHKLALAEGRAAVTTDLSALGAVPRVMLARHPDTKCGAGWYGM